MSVLALPVRGNRRATPTTRVVTLDLRGHSISYRAGQWARLGRDPRDGKPFSIANSPRDAREHQRLEFLIRADGWGAELATLRRGSRIHVDAPHGRFCLPDEFAGPAVLFIGGGTGIAPLRAMLDETLHRAAHPPCTVLYSARAASEFAYLSEFRALARAGRIRLALTITRDLRARWKGLSGRLGRAHLESFLQGPQTHCFVCGPEAFVADVRVLLEELGAKRIRTEEQ